MTDFASLPTARTTLRDILARARHDGCGGLVGKAELLVIRCRR